MMAEKKAAKGGKKPGKKHQKLAQVYVVEGGSIKKKNKFCPKCGPGFFMGDHKDRWSCGACGYMEKKK
jgi:small subunit ribosomal protein S27Ae